MEGKYRSLKPFLLWRELERPTDWQARFGRPGPLALEIGFGNGEYLTRQARERPDTNFVGLELHWASLRRTLRRLEQQDSGNVRVLQVDARVALERLFAPHSLDQACALFPCPWPKHKHQRHRLFSPDFLRLVNSRLRTGGEMLIVTDHESLHRQILSNVVDTGFACELRRVPPHYNTKYERRWTSEGQTEFFEFHLHKVEHIERKAPEEVAMVTFHVSGFSPHSLPPRGERGELVVEFKNVLYDPVQEVAMLLANVSEEGLNQCFWIEIVRSDRGWAISPAPGGGVVPTRSVYRALELVRDACTQGSVRETTK